MSTLSNHRPKKSMGQNFLVDGNLQRKIVHALDPGSEDEILEIGPGRGALTRHLVGRSRKLTLVELDRELAAALEEDLGGQRGVRIIQGDDYFPHVAASVVMVDRERLKQWDASSSLPPRGFRPVFNLAWH